MRRSAGILGTTLFILGILNFTAFWFISLALRGDAVSGKVEDGRYYLKGKGRYVEVSRAVWTYSRIHTISVFVTHPAGMLGIVLAAWASRGQKSDEPDR